MQHSGWLDRYICKDDISPHRRRGELRFKLEGAFPVVTGKLIVPIITTCG